MSVETGPTDTSRLISVRLSPGTHRALRIRVAEEDTSIQQWVEALIERELGLATKRGTDPQRDGAATRGTEPQISQISQI